MRDVPVGFNGIQDGIQEETAIHRIPGPTLWRDTGRPATFGSGSNRPVERKPRKSWPPFKTPGPGHDRAGDRLFGRAVADPAGRPRQPDAA